MKYATVADELLNNFKPRKSESLKLAHSFKRLNNLKYYDKVRNCGTLLDFNSSKKLVNASFCKNRLCPMCNWRRSMKICMNNSKIYEKLKDDYRFIFITLTVPNCKPDKLSDTIDKLQKGFTDWIKNNVNVKKSVKGYFRALEVTYNEKSKTFHPHFHLLAAVNPSYFDKSNRYYISHQYLLESWRRAMNDPSIKHVRIQVCRDKTTKSTTDIKSAIFEISKYVTKSDDYLKKSNKLTDEIVGTLSAALANRRLITMSGIIKKTAALLKLDVSEDGDLLNIDDDNDDVSASDDTVFRYIWKNDDYILYRVFMPDGTVIDAVTGEIIDDSGG